MNLASRLVVPVFLLFTLPSLSLGASSQKQLISSPIAHHLNYSNGFDKNTGWASPEVRFVGHGPKYRVSLTRTDMLFALRNPSRSRDKCPTDLRKLGRTKVQTAPCGNSSSTDITGLHLLGTNAHADAEGQKQLSSYSNYIVGNDPKKWHTHVPQFAEVWYRAIYPGIDLVYYTNDGFKRDTFHEDLLISIDELDESPQ